jgi:hypothetical protein
LVLGNVLIAFTAILVIFSARLLLLSSRYAFGRGSFIFECFCINKLNPIFSFQQVPTVMLLRLLLVLLGLSSLK